MSVCSTRLALQSDIGNIVAVTNEAFMADTFFKKPEFHLRFTEESATNMISSKDSVFILATAPKTSDGDETEAEEVIGSCFIHVFIETLVNIRSDSHIEKDIVQTICKATGKFSAVSVK